MTPMSDTPRASEEERLDEETERAIEDFRASVRRSMNEGRTPFGRLELARSAEQDSLAALRSRIRTLIEEARREGFRNVKDVSHLIEFSDD